MQELDLLDAFMRVYQRGSMTAAAADLGVSQPALTSRIARLEAKLGQRLFERSPRGTRPTADAERLAVRLAEPLGLLRGVMRSPDAALWADKDTSLSPALPSPLGSAAIAPRLSRVVEERVRLGGPAELVALRVLPGLNPLLSSGVRVDLELGQAADLLRRLAKGELDLVISAVRPKLPGVTAVPLVDEEFLLIGTASQGRSIDAGVLARDPAAALSHLPLVAYGPDLPIVRRYWLTLFGQKPVNPVALTVPDLRAVLAAVMAGAGISVLPRYIAAAALEAGGVQVLHRGEELPLNTVHLAWRAGEEGQALAAVRSHLLRAAQEWGTL